MKNKLIPVFVVPFLLALFTLSSCDKDSPGSARLLVVNASPDAPAFDILVDNNKINNGPLAYPGNTGYSVVPEGNRSIKVNEAGTTNNTLSATFGVEGNENYTMFIYDRNTTIKLLYVVDNLTGPASDKAYIRFFHFSPNGPTLTVGTLAGATFTPLFQNRAFETQNTALANSGFIAFNPGTYTFDVQVAGAGVSILTIPNVNLQGGKIYTFFARGLAGNPTTPFGIETILNN